MNNISKIISTLFRYGIYISLYFLWINYYYRNIFISFFLSIIISIITDKVIQIFVSKRNTYVSLKSTEKKLITDFSIHFLCSTKYENINYFSSLFHNPNTKKTKDYFIINDTTFLPYYFKRELTEDDIYTIYRSYNITTTTLVVLCSTISESAIAFSSSIENYRFVILDEKAVYAKFLKPLSATLPNTIKFKKREKLHFKEFLAIALNRHTAKGYFSSAFVILLSSLFIRYKIYYIVFATMLFVLSYISYFNVWYNRSTPNDFI